MAMVLVRVGGRGCQHAAGMPCAPRRQVLHTVLAPGGCLQGAQPGQSPLIIAAVGEGSGLTIGAGGSRCDLHMYCKPLCVECHEKNYTFSLQAAASMPYIHI